VKREKNLSVQAFKRFLRKMQRTPFNSCVNDELLRVFPKKSVFFIIKNVICVTSGDVVEREIRSFAFSFSRRVSIPHPVER
jgi:hypothetical protein